MNEVKGFFKEYEFLSNFYPCKVNWMGIDFPSSENAYQFAKLPTNHSEYILIKEAFQLLSASESKKAGKVIPIREDWNEVKITIMQQIVLNKFSTNLDLKQKLLDTGDAYLEETNYWKDTFWGVYNGNGTNHLGEILMQVRKILKNK